MMEVVRIDTNADLVTVYQPNLGKGYPVGTRPATPPLPPEAHGSGGGGGSHVQFYSSKNLPSSHWRKYELAAKFIKMVRSRTPKITLHFEEAKCTLYDTSPDFEALYYATGMKVYLGKDNHIKITSANDGATLLSMSHSSSACLSPELYDMYERTVKFQQFALEEEKIREKRKAIMPTLISFPATVGRKSVQGNKLTTNSAAATNNLLSNSSANPSSSMHFNQQLSSSHPNLALIGNTNDSATDLGNLKYFQI